jgi:AMIN domain-containing protein
MSGLTSTAWGASGVEVRRLGLSRVGETTLLTVVLDRSAEPRISTVQTPGKPQLVLDFPQAWMGTLPTRLEGDELIVEQVQTEATQGGVRIILDLYPNRAYSYWRRSQAGVGGQTLFLLGLKSESAAPGPAQQPPPAPGQPESPPAATGEQEWEPPPPQAPPTGNAVAGSLDELKGLLPQAARLLQSLENHGWTVSASHTYDHPGQRFSRDFVLINRQFPELAVEILYLPSDAPGTPNIGIIDLTTDKLQDETSAKYEELRHWDFSRIKKNYEDIGDFFEDALKPLRVKLREETKTIALKDAAVFQEFLRSAAPGNPQLADQVMAHVREKVNPRFEGVQYTISENPLIILNQVDFLYVKVFYLSSR